MIVESPIKHIKIKVNALKRHKTRTAKQPTICNTNTSRIKPTNTKRHL